MRKKLYYCTITILYYDNIKYGKKNDYQFPAGY